MHVDRNRLNRDELVFDFIAKQGIDRRSSSTPTRLRRGRQRAPRRRHDGCLRRRLVADDRHRRPYVTSPSHGQRRFQVRQHRSGTACQKALQVMDILVAKAKAEKK
jgi:thiol:disulfide interchange protein DsbA